METKQVIKAINENKSEGLVTALYKVSFPPILTFVRQKRGNLSDAEDCFQDALIVLIKKVKEKTYDEKYEVKNFLFVVARNLWFNKFTRNAKVKATDLDDYQIVDDSPHGEEIVIEDERQSAIKKLLDTAGERCKELLTLVIFDNKSLQEVADLMGFSSASVTKTNHYRCKQKMKQALKADRELLSMLKVG